MTTGNGLLRLKIETIMTHFAEMDGWGVLECSNFQRMAEKMHLFSMAQRPCPSCNHGVNSTPGIVYDTGEYCTACQGTGYTRSKLNTNKPAKSLDGSHYLEHLTAKQTGSSKQLGRGSGAGMRHMRVGACIQIDRALRRVEGVSLRQAQALRNYWVRGSRWDREVGALKDGKLLSVMPLTRQGRWLHEMQLERRRKEARHKREAERLREATSARDESSGAVEDDLAEIMCVKLSKDECWVRRQAIDSATLLKEQAMATLVSVWRTE